MDKKTVGALIQEEKVLLNFRPLKMNCKDFFKLKGVNNEFFLDYQIGETGTFITISKPFKETKQKYQLRPKGQYLVRLEVNARPHFCVDSGKLNKNHIHICCGEDEYGNFVYETYDLETFSATRFKDLTGRNILIDFFKLCNIQLEDGVSIQEVI